jgi:hypothetical protein
VRPWGAKKDEDRDVWMSLKDAAAYFGQQKIVSFRSRLRGVFKPCLSLGILGLLLSHSLFCTPPLLSRTNLTKASGDTIFLRILSII